MRASDEDFKSLGRENTVSASNNVASSRNLNLSASNISGTTSESSASPNNNNSSALDDTVNENTTSTQLIDTMYIPTFPYNPDAPANNLLIYDAIIKLNNAYMYAVDARNTGPPKMKQPGDYHFRKNSNIPQSEIRRLQSIVATQSANQDPEQVCQAMTKLMYIDGINPVEELTPEQLYRPMHSYIAVIVEQTEGKNAYVPKVTTECLMY